MPYKILPKDEYNPFVKALASDCRVVAPVNKEGKYVFGDISGPQDIAEGYIPTLLPPKKYVFPPKEDLLQFTVGESPSVEPTIEAEPLVVFGVRPCDINGIRLLDKVFMDDIVDPNYAARREQISIIGIDCEEHCDEHCFCESIGSLAVSSGYDLFLTDMGKYWMVNVGTKKGGALMFKYASVREADSDSVAALLRNERDKIHKFPRRFTDSATMVPMLLLGSYTSDVWNENGDKCLACGACNLTCPTCNCFDVLDVMNLQMTGGTRERKWDGCMLEEFAAVAGGENFRKNRSNRIRHRMYRKLKYQAQRFGEPFCVGCGRCGRQCPVDINVPDMVNNLFEQSKQEAAV